MIFYVPYRILEIIRKVLEIIRKVLEIIPFFIGSIYVKMSFMGKKLTNNEFIKRSNEIHGNKYRNGIRNSAFFTDSIYRKM